jgi:hypothetical protein
VTDQWTTPYGDVPPTQNQPPQWRSYPPPPPTWDKSQNQSWNGMAVASFVLGILPSLIAVGLGIVSSGPEVRGTNGVSNR